MNNFKKIAAVFLAVIMVVSLCACSKLPKTADAQWSYKSESTEYAMGIHVYSLVSAYNQAYSILSEELGDEFDSEGSILDLESSFDEEGMTYVCKDWILKEADYITKNLIAIDNMIEEYGVELDSAVEASAYEWAQEDWHLGSYYEEYLAYGYSATPYKDILEPCGISFESFYEATYLASVKQNAIFDHLYNKGGVKAVSESEIKDYFEENYTSYAYFTVDLYESSTDSNTGSTVNTALADDKIADIKENLELYVSMIANGTTYDDITEVYTAYAELSYNPSVSNIENLEDTSLAEEVSSVIAAMKDGEAKVIYVGEEDSTVAYFLYKKPITSETTTYVASETNYDALLQEMKSDEFLDDLDVLTDAVVCEINTSEVDKYTPALIEELVS